MGKELIQLQMIMFKDSRGTLRIASNFQAVDVWFMLFCLTYYKCSSSSNNYKKKLTIARYDYRGCVFILFSLFDLVEKVIAR